MTKISMTPFQMHCTLRMIFLVQLLLLASSKWHHGSRMTAFAFQSPAVLNSLYVAAGRGSTVNQPLQPPSHGNDNNILPSQGLALYPLYRHGLFLSKTNGELSNNKLPSGNNKKKFPVPNPLTLAAKMVKSSIKFQADFRKKFAALSRKGKIVVSIQLLVIGLFFGYSTKTVTRHVFHGGGGGAAKMTVMQRKPMEVPYSVFMDMVERSGKGHAPGQNPAMKVDQIVIGRENIGFKIRSDEEKHLIALKNQKLVESNDISVQKVKERQLYASKVNANPELIKFLRDNSIPFRAASTKGTNALAMVARSSIILIYMLFLLRMYRTISGGGGGGSGDTPGKLAKTLASDPKSMIKFDDIEGIDNAKFEVMELVDTLKNPGKYAILGARAPTGLLLEGPPGTGKTMLARACAATAGVPLLYCSGSDFVEMFVGRGAARVRKTFERASRIAPCIIFIDELDALGKSRGSEIMGMQMRSNDEAEQTLNQLLACMDGLDSKKGICVLAATNRREVLDPALIRPGRFDRIIKVTLPDASGRERILRVHAKKLPGFKECNGVDPSRPGSLGRGDAVDLSAVAAVTSNLSGAELEFIVNEAAIRAVRRVSSALREGIDPADIKSPAVCAKDFEDSVKSFFESRRPTSGGGIFDALKRSK